MDAPERLKDKASLFGRRNVTPLEVGCADCRGPTPFLVVEDDSSYDKRPFRGVDWALPRSKLEDIAMSVTFVTNILHSRYWTKGMTV